MRIAAIDCGSNSFHLLIADAYGHDQMEVVEDDKSLLYLGAEVAKSGEISSASLTRARRVIRHYKTLIERHDVKIVRCVATSAIRSASNGSQVIESLSKSLGHEIRVISGDEEAETIFRAISALSALPETRILGCDMGGGSLELMAGQRHGLEYACSVPLGASRLASQLEVNDPLSKTDIENIETQCQNLFKDFAQRYPKDLFSNIVASSGTLTTLVSMARANVDGFVSPPMTIISAETSEIENICQSLIKKSPKDRSKMIGYDKARDIYLPTAAVVALEIMKLGSKSSNWMISPYALREGMVLKIADKHVLAFADEISIANKTIDDLVQRITHIRSSDDSQRTNVNSNKSLLVSHGENVQKLSLTLFDQLKPVHQLDNTQRRLLDYGARIHDIGETISHSKHDQHGAYILSNIPLTGLSPEEAKMIRGMIRWHRSRNPRENEQFVGKLNERDLITAKWLTAILRIADGADAGKSGAVSKINVTINPDVVFLRFFCETDCELELYSARRKRHLFEQISQRDLVIEPATIGHQQELD